MKTNLGTIVDALGTVRAQITELKKQEEGLKASLVEAGVGAYEGALFRATVSEYERSTLDMEAVRAKLSAQFIRAHTLVTDTIRVAVKARNGVGIAA